MLIEIKNISKMKVACVRHIGPYMECEKAWKILLKANLPLDKDTKFLGICHDNPDVTPADKIRYDACVTVPDDFFSTNSHNVKIQEIEGGKYATYLHKGSYSKLKSVYDSMYNKWIPENGYKWKCESPIEFYRNDSHVTETDNLETEVCVPIE